MSNTDVKSNKSLKSDVDTTRWATKTQCKNFFDRFHTAPVCQFPTTRASSVDMMEVYRPKRKDLATRVRDYNLEQTYHILDQDPVKIKVIDTLLTLDNRDLPSNKPLRKDRSKKPQTFLSELWAKEIDKMQAKAWTALIEQMKWRRNFTANIARRRKEKIKRYRGPDWFQELSNLQRAAVDELKTTIIADLKANVVNNTKYNLERLGLVLRPNDNHVEYALKHCCSCPIEFLLVLYQVLDPTRTSYSINDRLLLSAVYHLTIRATLKELHIRIPSPPRKPRKIKEKVIPEPEVPLKSPYLEKMQVHVSPGFRFNPPAKVYVTNEYFDYVKILKANRITFDLRNENPRVFDKKFIKVYDIGVCVCDSCHEEDCKAIKGMDGFTKMEIQLLKEWSRAQKYYAGLSIADTVDILHKPSVYIRCTQFHSSKKYCGYKAQASEDKTVDVERKQILEEKQRRQTIEKVHIAWNQDKNDDKDDEVRKSLKNISEGHLQEVTVQLATIPNCGCFPNSMEVEQSNSENEEGVLSKIALEYEQFVRCEEEIECSDWETLSEESQPCAPSTVRDYNIGKTLEVKVVDSLMCNCKEKILEKLAKYCQCEKCVEDRRTANRMVKYRIEDTQENVEPPNKIVGGAITKPICNCIEKYMNLWAKFEERRGIRKVQEALKSLDERFIITGTAVGRDGNITYIIQSVQPEPPQCRCYKVEQDEAEERQLIAQMPKIPDGCIKYIVQGVKSTPNGNIYILTGTTQNSDCECMGLYRKFMLEHSICMHLYHQYLKKIAFDTEQYLNALNPDYNSFSTETIAMTCLDPCAGISKDSNDVDTCDCCPENVVEPQCECLQRVCCEEECVCGTFDLSLFEQVSSVVCSCNESCSNSDHHSTTAEVALDRKASTLKTPDAENVGKQVQYPSKFTEEKNPKREKRKADVGNEEEAPEFERYVIYKKWPRMKDLIETIRIVLAKMADDGFPLAKLPLVHTLPIFLCWCRYRFRTYYTRKQVAKCIHTDTALFGRINGIYKRTRVRERSSFLIKNGTDNWDHRNRIKNHNEALKSCIYRQGKVASIDFARDIYCMLRQYQLPNKSFRDVFFSYMPSKEEDLFPDKIWKSGEIVHSALDRK